MKTMQKNKGLKKRGKGLALGICAAILGTVGVAWIPHRPDSRPQVRIPIVQGWYPNGGST